jgi:ABC-type Mn2+/Zn2+ transport system permease subunit
MHVDVVAFSVIFCLGFKVLLVRRQRAEDFESVPFGNAARISIAEVPMVLVVVLVLWAVVRVYRRSAANRDAMHLDLGWFFLAFNLDFIAAL